ncbi:hypothetical protein PGT21_036450 [Puccinia graminis f. sp. tritici]|uniref:Uncharacterized protein n=1 Tax=Puccinia graminis f. sp. tritici TaxID=56615 RepID=A0A5B0R4K7_PUCGR|nr:hypothetical protein PGT21_036450 [Puccinia graminis f. sp. tritici]
MSEHSRRMIQSLIPWKAFSDPRLLQTSPNYFNHDQPVSFHTYNSLKPIFDEGSIREMGRLKISNKFEPENRSEEAWAWISRVRLNKRFSYNKSFQPISEKSLDEVKAYIRDFSRKHLPEERRVILWEKSENRIFETLDTIFDILWGLNDQFLILFGCKQLGEEYTNEKKSMQLFFLSCFSNFKPEESEDIVDMKEAELSKIMRGKVLNLMVNILTVDQNEDMFLVKPTSSHSNFSTLKEGDLILGVLAVTVLGYYYKNENHKKYTEMFEKDRWFFHFLISRSSQIFYGSKSFNRKTVIKFNEYKNFP